MATVLVQRRFPTRPTAPRVIATANPRRGTLRWVVLVGLGLNLVVIGGGAIIAEPAREAGVIQQRMLRSGLGMEHRRVTTTALRVVSQPDVPPECLEDGQVGYGFIDPC